jgi:hypothetical protein
MNTWLTKGFGIYTLGIVETTNCELWLTRGSDVSQLRARAIGRLYVAYFRLDDISHCLD